MVNLFSDLKDDVGKWQDLYASNPDQREGFLRFETDWFELYSQLSEVFEKTRGLISAVEAHGHKIDEKQEFLQSWRELWAIVCLDAQGVPKAFEQIRSGQVRSLKEVRDELWPRSVIGGSRPALA